MSNSMASSGVPPICLELPLYRKPSGNWRSFIETANKHQVYIDGAYQYESGFRVLRFIAKLNDEKKAEKFLADSAKKSASYRPLTNELEQKNARHFEEQVEHFTSKFFAAMAYATGEKSRFSIEIIERKELPIETQQEIAIDYLQAIYGHKVDITEKWHEFEKGVHGVLRVTFYCKQMAVREILSNFFALLDSNVRY